MLRMWIVCALAGALFVPGNAPGDEAQPTETIVKFNVTPAATPKPAFRYLLLPEIKEISPGNPIHAYMICFAEQQNFFFNKEVVVQREKWLTAPLKELPDLKNYGGLALRQADYAARLETPDWGINLKMKKEGIGLLLPDLQQLRSLATALKVRFRGEVKDRRFDDAIRTAATMFALSRHLGEHPTLIGELVAIAVGMITIGPLEELIQQPGCPNLYWSLTALPTPFIDLRKGLQGEKVFMGAELPMLTGTDPLSAAQIEKTLQRVRSLVAEIAGVSKDKDGKEEDLVELIRSRAKDEKALAAARKALLESGLTNEQLKAMPPIQVILLYEVHLFEIDRDDAIKWAMVPYWKAQNTYIEMGAVKLQGGNLVGRGVKRQSIFGGLAPSVAKVHQAQTRIEQRLAMLRHLEALRLYAAEHSGKLPPTLADAGVPLPSDPFTGKPFIYELKENTAIIRGSPPKGMEKSAPYNIRYEVTIKH